MKWPSMEIANAYERRANLGIRHPYAGHKLALGFRWD